MVRDLKGLKQAVREAVKEKAVELGEDVLRKVAPPPASPPPEVAGEAAYVCSVPWSGDRKPQALVIMCSSYVFRLPCAEFLAKGLHLNDYDVVAVPGGVQWLALPDILPKHHKVARGVAEFLIERHGLSRIICIAHQGCSAYEGHEVLSSLARLATGKSAAEHQLAELRQAGRDLAEWFGVASELYYASVSDGAVAFHKVEPLPS